MEGREITAPKAVFTRDAFGQFGDSNHAAANDHRSGLNFADTSAGQ
jgi:hypothetical protein